MSIAAQLLGPTRSAGLPAAELRTFAELGLLEQAKIWLIGDDHDLS